ncbi:MAG: hypothetical protein HY815_23015 [Candidatus Riflebacteria bacterium]|nr:hypothetical protein [Candidatus Riflebacteria bacterium]
MPLDQGRYVLKVGEIFEIPKGLAQIEEDLRRSRKARLNNLPTDLAVKFLPLTVGYKGLEVGLVDETQKRTVPGLPDSAKVVKSQWYQIFLGDRLNMGEILTPTALYHVLWKPDQIRRIFQVTDPNFLEFVWKKNFMMRMEDEQIYATVFDRHEGLDVIREKVKKAAVFRACVVPPALLRDLLPFALKADYRIITSRRDPLVAQLKADPEVRSGSEAKIYFVYGGEESNVGSLRINHELFSIFWREDRIFNVMRYDNLIFGNFLSRVFDTAWKYSKKLTGA